MTETQAKSAAAGELTEPAHGSDGSDSVAAATESEAGPVTGGTDKPTTPGTDSSSSDSSPTVIRRSGAVEAAQAKPEEKGPAPSAAPSRPVSESSPTTRLSVSEATARAEATARTAPGSRTATAPTSPTGRATVPTRVARPGDVSPVRGAAAGVGAAAAVGAARVSETLRTARATVAGAASRGPRRARLHLKRIDPWSVMKFSFAVSLVLFVVAIVATSVLYLALDAMNVFDSVNKAVGQITGSSGSDASGFRITAKGVIGTSVLLGAVNMVLFTALATLGAFVYNVCADLVGGVELTLSEKE